MVVLQKLKIELLYDLANPPLGIYPKELGSQRDTQTSMFMAALLTVGKRWERPECPSVDEWINKMSYVHIMEQYSALERKEGLPWWLSG